MSPWAFPSFISFAKRATASWAIANCTRGLNMARNNKNMDIVTMITRM